MKQCCDGYWVHESGRVYDDRKSKMKPVFASIGGGGYKTVRINGKTKLLHRVVAEAYLGQIPEDCHVHHKDGDKLNNCLSNLEIVHKTDHGKRNFEYAQDMPRNPKTRLHIKAREMYGDEAVNELYF